jgi:hypothetical protein
MMKPRSLFALSGATTTLCLGLALLAPAPASPALPAALDWTVVGWNDLGMHCMDSDYEIFSILPPYNNIHAQVFDASGHLITNPNNVTLTFKAVADAYGSINVTSAGKTNFWEHSLELFGAAPPVDQGLAGYSMPGLGNTPQVMDFDAGNQWFSAEGVPITPTEDLGHSNAYPMMRLEARDANGMLRATTDIVLPVSEEMDCRACHASGAGPEAKPAGGWVGDLDFERDYRLNVLKLHDENEAGNPAFAAALANFNFNPAGLLATVQSDGKSILCSACHGSNALPGTGFGNIAPLTSAIHTAHAPVTDPISGMVMDQIENRASCYRCHPGSETRCLRGAMGKAVAPDGSMAMQCQACHGNMSTVGDPAREGWLDQPSCQECHTGSATHNNGQIRFTSVFEPSGAVRIPVSDLFATNANTPLPGKDLYRFSTGHNDVQCEACHGSTHAIFPSAHASDNVQSIELQGHAGTVSDCLSCHATQPNTVKNGPHGMHPVGQSWISGHHDAAADGKAAQCKECHGTDYRGTELSRAQGPRTLSTKYGTKTFWEGYEIGCYDCHKGPTSDDTNPNKPPVAQSLNASTTAGTSVLVNLLATDPGDVITGGRIVGQGEFGSVALSGTQATYFPFAGFAGTDHFTYAVTDGDSESNLATVTVQVGAGWETFGEGHPGTLGVPAFDVSANPVLGTTISVHVGNSAPGPALGILAIGKLPNYQPTIWEGILLVKDPSLLLVALPLGGATVNHKVSPSTSLIGMNQVAQLLVVDPGASQGLAFSKGLRLTLGQ